MKEKKEHWLKSSWTMSIASVILSFLLTIANDYFKSRPILYTIKSILTTLGKIILIVLKFDIKVWFLILAVFVFYLINKLRKKNLIKPDFYNYREEKFKRWKWSWKWEINYNKSGWFITDLKAHCPNCDTPMIEHTSKYGLNFDCPRCDFIANDGQCDEPHKIERIILDNVQRKSFVQ